MFQVLKINDTIISSPCEITWTLQDVSKPDAGRDLAGYMHKERVTQKRKLTCKWPAMTLAEASLLLRNVNSEYFQLTYYDVMAGGTRTGEFYVGDRTAPFLWISPGSQYVKSVSFDFIER